MARVAVRIAMIDHHFVRHWINCSSFQSLNLADRMETIRRLLVWEIVVVVVDRSGGEGGGDGARYSRVVLPD